MIELGPNCCPWDTETIARAKAVAAWKILGRSVLVQDSGLVIKALSDFPGPYTKYVVSTIGIAGLLRLLQGYHGDDRRCGFDSCMLSGMRSLPF